MIGYPDGRKFKEKKEIVPAKKKGKVLLNAANRGMNFETDINISNAYYLDKGLMMINKRTTPISIVKVDYSKKSARITDAYFEKQSTTDYNGVYKGKYIDFEAKSTKSKSSFPLSNIYSHQIEHLKNVIANGGIAFFLICFESQNKVFLLDAKWIISFFENGKRRSIPYQTFLEEGIEVKRGYNPRLYYLDAIEEKYFK